MEDGKERFLRSVRVRKSDRLLRAHKQLISLLEVAGLTLEFDAPGSEDCDYQVKLPGLKGHVLRVAARGKIFAYWYPLGVHPDVKALYRSAMRGIVLDASKPHGSRLRESIESADLPALVDDLKALVSAIRH
jgi:hypothetical protein